MELEDLVSKETLCCVGGKVKHQNKLSTRGKLAIINLVLMMYNYDGGLMNEWKL